MFLLAKFRETWAYPLVLRIAFLPGETVFELLATSTVRPSEARG
jgi:Protein of unknown function (DUF1186)